MSDIGSRVSIGKRSRILLEIQELLCSEEQEKEVLSNIQYVAEAASKIGGSLAGGCIRDLVLGKEDEIKDYDIFLKESELRVDLPVEVFGNYKFIPRTRNMREEVVGVKKYYDYNIDVVIHSCNDIRELVSTFDASICQAWVEKDTYEGVNCVYCSWDFLAYLVHEQWFYYVDILTNDHLWRMVKKHGVFTPCYKPPYMYSVCLGSLDDICSGKVDPKEVASATLSCL